MQNQHFAELCLCGGVCSRFDMEQNQAQTEVQRERSQREKLAREKDLLTGEMFNLRQQLQVSYSTYPLSGTTSDITGLVPVQTFCCVSPACRTRTSNYALQT